ncbi:hypothetical protein M271_23580 [Streptomyces rapamycinicus NRRL 5491]|nr:hypothetical protein M271_23580 [Streptomyces rapamycinicus NRRL 5491]
MSSVGTTQVVLGSELPDLPRHQNVHFNPLDIKAIKIFIYYPISITWHHITFMAIQLDQQKSRSDDLYVTPIGSAKNFV